MVLKRLGFIAIITCAASAFVACSDSGASTPGGGGTGTGGGNGAAAACDMSADPTACGTCLDTAQSLGQTLDALVTCTCQYCYNELQACYQGPDDAENAKCRAVVECGQTNGCKGTECYCGVGVDINTCLMNGPMGPCRNEIVTAAGCEGSADAASEAVCVQMARSTAGSTLANASAVGACSTGDPGLMPPAEGHCANM